MVKPETDMEILAERLHGIWARWLIHYSKNYSPDNMHRWIKLAHTSYANLPEDEKEKDREIIRELLHLNK